MLSLSTASLISLAATLVTAGPTNTKPVSWKPSDKHLKICDKPTFSAASDVTPSNWRDCAALYSRWAIENGTFILNQVAAADDGLVTILKYDSCTLAVRRNGKDEGPFQIGDVDVNDILKGALLDFSSGTILSAQGEVSCPVDSGEKKCLHWQVFDSEN